MAVLSLRILKVLDPVVTAGEKEPCRVPAGVRVSPGGRRRVRGGQRGGVGDIPCPGLGMEEC